MDIVLRTIVLIAILVGTPVGIIVFVLWITKKFGRRKLGYWIVGIIVVVLLLYPASFILEDVFFSKKDMKEMLGEHDFILNDDFKVNSKSISGIRDLLYEFEITITDSDRNRLINEFLKSDYYLINPPDGYSIMEGKPRYSQVDTSFYVTFQNKLGFEYQYYQPNKQGYSPQLDLIRLSKENNTISFQRIFD